MPYLIAGILAFVAVLFLLRGVQNGDPKKISDGLRIGALMALGAVGLFMLVTGRIAFAVPLIAGALAFTRRRLFNQFLSRVLGAVLADPKPQQTDAQSPRQPNVHEVMTRVRALEILGLPHDAGTDDIKAAHRRLMQSAHPDHGGNAQQAALLNAAKDFLLGD